MKKFLLKVLLFFACVVIMDWAFGLFFSYLRAHAKGGSTANCEYIANKAMDDIIILGSSRATHHYISQIVEDSLSVSCYNCGEEGNGVVLAYGRLKMLTNRYKPKLILYEITPSYDYGKRDPNNKYLGYLRAYYNKDGIRKIFEDFDDELSCVKMMSNMYQNTSRLLPNIVDNLVVRDNQKGYSPLYGKMDFSKSKHSYEKIEIDSSKYAYLQKIIELCQGNDIPLVFMVSPWYCYGDNMEEYEPAFRLCKQKGVIIANYINDPIISRNFAMFQDNNHLNNEGAIAFTHRILPLIKEVMKNIDE